MVYISGVKVKHKSNCLDPNIKVKRIYIRAFNKKTGRQSFEPLGLICETCFSISLSESYCKKMNDKPAKIINRNDVKVLISKGLSKEMTSYEDMMKLKNRIASDEELTVSS